MSNAKAAAMMALMLLLTAGQPAHSQGAGSASLQPVPTQISTVTPAMVRGEPPSDVVEAAASLRAACARWVPDQAPSGKGMPALYGSEEDLLCGFAFGAETNFKAMAWAFGILGGVTTIGAILSFRLVRKFLLAFWAWRPRAEA